MKRAQPISRRYMYNTLCGWGAVHFARTLLYTNDHQGATLWILVMLMILISVFPTTFICKAC